MLDVIDQVEEIVGKRISEIDEEKKLLERALEGMSIPTEFKSPEEPKTKRRKKSTPRINQEQMKLIILEAMGSEEMTINEVVKLVKKQRTRVGSALKEMSQEKPQRVQQTGTRENKKAPPSLLYKKVQK